MSDTRATLLGEAETLVRRRGYSGFSYADLAEAVGIRKASIHHHFRTKEDLAVALLAAYEARYAAALATIEESRSDGLSRVTAYGRLYLGGVEQGLGCLCAAFATEGDALPERLRADVAAFFARHIAWIEETLRRGRADGSVRPDIEPGPQARMIVATLEGALITERLLDGPSGFGSVLAALAAGLQTASATKPS